MRDTTIATTSRISRRRLIAVAGGATAAVTLGPAVIAAQQSVEATPTEAIPATTPALPEFPVPSTLAADASPLFRTVADAVVDAMRTSLVPGVAIGLLSGEREEHAVFGLASLSSMLPVTPKTLFQVGSISKTHTSTAIWRLIDEGALDLDAPLRSYIPELTLMDESVAERVTISNLLDHSAGWYGDEGFDTGVNDDSLARYVAERLPQLPQIFPLGEYCSYNNAAFTVLGRLIEIATGTTYNVAMQNLLFGPVGLEESVLDHDEVVQRPYSDGHAALPINGRISVAVQTPLWVPRSVDPAGGIWSTTSDLLRYARFHMNGSTVASDAQVVQPTSLAQMREPVIDFPGLPLQMGKNWFVQDVEGIRVAFHGGDTLGQHAELFMIPGHDFALAVLTNAQGGGAAVAASALNTALAEVPELAPLVGQIGLASAVGVPAEEPTVDLPAADVAEYVGRYADLGQAITLTQTDAGLELTLETIDQEGGYAAAINPTPAPPLPVTFLARDVATFAGARLPIIRDAEGRVAWVSSGLRLLPRVD